MDKFRETFVTIAKLISSFMESSDLLVEVEEEVSYHEPFPVLGVKPSDLVYYVSPKRANFSAVDGSSKSLISSGGIVSVAAVAVTGISVPLRGVYPHFTGLRGLEMKAPFIALAPSTKGRNNVLLASLDYIMLRSIDGTPLDASLGVSRVETELRSNLETEAISHAEGTPLLDGPLLPSYSSLPSEVRRELVRRRYRRLPKGAVGIVKRIDRSKLLVEALNPYAKELEARFGLSNVSFLNDEALVSNLVRRLAVPPFKPMAFGPVIYEPHGVRVYAYYLALPLHPHVRKFSIIRVESLTLREGIVDEVASLPLGTNGVPYPIAYADKVAREVRGGLVKALKLSLESFGIGVSYAGNMAVMTS